jgi:hypothetical protein
LTWNLKMYYSTYWLFFVCYFPVWFECHKFKLQLLWKIIGLAGKIPVQGMAENVLCLYIPWYQGSRSATSVWKPLNRVHILIISQYPSLFCYYARVMKSEANLVVLTNFIKFYLNSLQLRWQIVCPTFTLSFMLMGYCFPLLLQACAGIVL